MTRDEWNFTFFINAKHLTALEVAEFEYKQ